MKKVRWWIHLPENHHHPPPPAHRDPRLRICKRSVVWIYAMMMI